MYKTLNDRKKKIEVFILKGTINNATLFLQGGIFLSYLTEQKNKEQGILNIEVIN